MDRRHFIKSLGAAALLPAMPVPSAALPVQAAAATVSSHTYQWAEMIVRAHNKCNLGLLQRSLQINEATASLLKSQLIENGIVSAQANAYGIHTATKPLYEGAFMSVSDTTREVINSASELADDLLTEETTLPDEMADEEEVVSETGDMQEAATLDTLSENLT